MVGRKCRGTHFGCTDVYACVVYACVARLYACVAKLYVCAYMFINSHGHIPQHAHAYTNLAYAYTRLVYTY